MIHGEIDIKRAIRDRKGVVTFQWYCSDDLFYQTEAGEMFTIPISDTGNTRFDAEIPAILTMRWMRLWNEKLAQEIK